VGDVILRDSSRVAPACHASRNEENPLLVTFDQDFKRLEIPTLRSGDQDQVTFVGQAVDRSDCRLFFVDAVFEFGSAQFGSFLKLMNQSA
jgi:hypothetical protein